MRIIVALSCLLLATSSAWGQVFTFGSTSRGIVVFGSDGDYQSHETNTLMPFDLTLTAGTPTTNFASAYQTSCLTPSEILISGGTGDIFWDAANPVGGSRAWSAANVTFAVSAPAQVRIRHELVIDVTSFRTWTAGAGLIISRATPIVAIGASTRSNEAMVLSPTDAFEIGADGFARGVFDEIVTFLPDGSWELRTDANSICPSPTETEMCVGKPITFTTHLQIIPEPPTALFALAAAAVFAFAAARRRLVIPR